MTIKISHILVTVILLVAWVGVNAYGQTTFKPCGTPRSINHLFTVNGVVIDGPLSNANSPSFANPNAIKNSHVTLYQAAADGLQGCAVGAAKTNLYGRFRMKFSNKPQPGAIIYLVAQGGNAGDGTNSAIGLMTILGVAGPDKKMPFPGNLIQATVNELTTVAAQWELAQFNDFSGGTLSASRTNTAGIANAVNQVVNDLVDPASGAPATFLPSATQCSSVSRPINCDALERLNTLANILAACVRSAGTSSAPCTALLQTTQTDGMLQAAHAIATNPGENVSPLFALQSETAPFAPALSQKPNDFTVALNFSPAGAGFETPVSVALDAIGNVWTTNAIGPNGSTDCGGSGCGSVSELTASSGYTTGLNFAPAGAGFATPVFVALDATGNVWTTNAFVPTGSTDCGGSSCGSVSELTASSGYTTGFNFAPANAGFDFPVSLALDATGNVWATNERGPPGSKDCVDLRTDGEASSAIAEQRKGCGSVSELTASSGYTTGHNFAPADAGFDFPVSLVLDATGNVLITNQLGPPGAEDCGGEGCGSVSELTASSGYTTGHNFAPADAGFDFPVSLVLDATENVLITNAFGPSGSIDCGESGCGSVSELTASSGYTTGHNFAPAGAGIFSPAFLALDATGNVWLPNEVGPPGSKDCGGEGCGSVSKLNASSGYTTGHNFAPAGAGFETPASVALDASGNVWITITAGPPGSKDCGGEGCGSVSEILGLANPVLTPKQTCLINGKSVCPP
jgi:hypothetical protein